METIKNKPQVWDLNYMTAYLLNLITFTNDGCREFRNAGMSFDEIMEEMPEQLRDRRRVKSALCPLLNSRLIVFNRDGEYEASQTLKAYIPGCLNRLQIWSALDIQREALGRVMDAVASSEEM